MSWDAPRSVTPLQCAVTKNAPASALESALTKLLDLKSPGINSYKKCGGYQPPWWDRIPGQFNGVRSDAIV
jgi:hypothetical protein